MFSEIYKALKRAFDKYSISAGKKQLTVLAFQPNAAKCRRFKNNAGWLSVFGQNAGAARYIAPCKNFLLCYIYHINIFSKKFQQGVQK